MKPKLVVTDSDILGGRGCQKCQSVIREKLSSIWGKSENIKQQWEIKKATCGI
jgi:hypothetical protein